MRGGERDEVGIVSREERRDGRCEGDRKRACGGQQGKRAHHACAHEFAQAVVSSCAAVEAGDGLQAVRGAEAQHVQQVDHIAVDDGECGQVAVAAERSQVVVDDDGVQKACRLHEEQRQPLPDDRAAHVARKPHAGQCHSERRAFAELEAQDGEKPQARGHAVVRPRCGEPQVQHVHANIQPRERHRRGDDGQRGGERGLFVGAQKRAKQLPERAERVEAHEQSDERRHVVVDIGGGAEERGDVRCE